MRKCICVGPNVLVDLLIIVQGSAKKNVANGHGHEVAHDNIHLVDTFDGIHWCLIMCLTL